MIPSPYNKTRIIEKLKTDAAIVKLAQDLVAVHEKFIQKLEEHDLKKVGPKGDKPTKQELLEIIIPLIPEVEDGKTPTEEEILKIITPLIPEAQKPTEEELLQIIRPLIPKIEVPTKEELLSEIKPLIPEINIEKIAKLAAAIVKVKLPKPINIEELLKGKKFEIDDINGLEEVLKSIKKHGDHKPYLHGSGVPSLSAGTNVTLTPKTDGGYTISVAGAGTWYEDEVLARTDGTNYTLAHSPTTVVFLFKNGQRIASGGSDYTRTGTAIVMVTPTLSTDVITATYA